MSLTFQRARVLALAIRGQIRFERSLERTSARIISATAKRVAATWEASETMGAAMAVVDEQNESWRQGLVKTYKGTAGYFAGRVFRDFNSKKGIAAPRWKEEEFSDTFLQRLLSFIGIRSSEAIVDITATTKRIIRATLALGLEEGIGPMALARRLREKIGDLNTPRGRITARVRANMIARTETHSAAGFSSQAATEALSQDYDIEFKKEWIAAEDERTRPEHAQANNINGQIGLQDYFVVGDEKLLYPGDPAGSAGNIINCRCTVLEIPID